MKLPVWLYASLLAAAMAPRALAQEIDDSTRAAARALAIEASELYANDSYEQAYDRFNRAYQLVRVPTVGLWAARSLVKLGRLVEASERFLEVSREPVADDAPPEHERAKEEAAAERQALLARIPSVRVLVEGAAPGEVFVTLNGELVPTALVGAQRPVNPGQLTVKGTRGEQVVEAAVEIREGETRDVRLVFAAPPGADKPASAPPPGRLAPLAPLAPAPRADYDAGEGSTQRTLGYVALGLGGAGLAFGALFGALGLGDESDLEDACPGRRCEPEHHAALDAYETKRTLSTVGFASGAVFAATGAVLLLSAPSSPPDTARAPRGPALGVFARDGALGVFGSIER